MKIKYEFANETVEVEVSEEWGSIIVDLDRQEYNANHRETRRHCSLDALDQDDNLLPSEEDIELAFLIKERNQELYQAIKKLSPRQRHLITEVYFKERKITEIARAEGLSHRTIGITLDRAIKNLKKFL